MKIEDFYKRKQGGLLQEFKAGLGMRVYGDEHKILDLKSAAVMAADYKLAHGKSGFSYKLYPIKNHWSGHNSQATYTIRFNFNVLGICIRILMKQQASLRK